MPDNSDLDRRVADLEREVVRLRERGTIASSDAAAARVLASGADHDVTEVRAELRAHNSVLGALRETQLEMLAAQLEMRQDQVEMRQEQVEMREEQVEMRRDQVEMRQDIDRLDQRMTEGFATMNTGMAQIVTLITTVIDNQQGDADRG